jgi:acid phosphatase type 7
MNVRKLEWMGLVFRACACGLFAAPAALAAEQEIWFVSDIMAPVSSTLDCNSNQSMAEKTAAFVRNNKQANAVVVTTEANNCRDYSGAYDAFFAKWLSPSGFSKSTWLAVPGNHDYLVKSGGAWVSDNVASAFRTARQGAALGETNSWMTMAGPWLLVGIDSELNANTSPSMTSLAADLHQMMSLYYAWGVRCQVAFAHRPAYSNASKHANDGGRLNSSLVNELAQFHTELVLSGHEHVYERLAPNATTGLVQIVAGTGGVSPDGSSGTYTWNNSYTRGAVSSGFSDRSASKNGVLRLVLRDDKTYLVQFYAVSSSGTGTLTDSFSGSCQQ